MLRSTFQEPYTKRFRKTEKMSRISYIASSGGLLGLCMGFSFVSLAEIAYHLFLCFSLLCKKRRSMACYGGQTALSSSASIYRNSSTRKSNNGRDPYDRIEANGNRFDKTLQYVIL
jgi:hypothetical protein